MSSVCQATTAHPQSLPLVKIRRKSDFVWDVVCLRERAEWSGCCRQTHLLSAVSPMSC